MSKLKKQTKFLLVALPLAATAFGCSKLMDKETNKLIEFKDVQNIEYGETVKSLSFIQNIDGEIVNYPNLETYKLGLNQIEYSVKNKGDEYTVKRTVQVVDTQSPIIELMSNRVELKRDATFEPLSNIERIYDVVDGNLETYSVIHDVDTSTPGEYEVVVRAMDKNMNIQVEKYIVAVEGLVEKPVEEKEENQLRYIENILFINKQYSLPSSYKEDNEEALNALKKLQEAAKKEGHELAIIDDYISYSEQKRLYNEALKDSSYEVASKTVEKPGHSEHQAGLAFDVGSKDKEFGNTDAGKWLAEHCAEFGFIIRYPEGKEEITGYEYSPSHIRYVGEKHAKLIHQWKITLEEYLGVKA